MKDLFSLAKYKTIDVNSIDINNARKKGKEILELKTSTMRKT